MNNSLLHIEEMRHLISEIRIQEDFIKRGWSSSDARTQETNEMELRTYLAAGVPIQEFRDRLAELRKKYDEQVLARWKAHEEANPTPSNPPASQPKSCLQDPDK